MDKHRKEKLDLIVAIEAHIQKPSNRTENVVNKITDRIKQSWNKHDALKYEEEKRRTTVGDKKMTVDEKSNFIVTQEKYGEFKTLSNRLKRDQKIVRAYTHALELKKDMVQTKSSNRRREM